MAGSPPPPISLPLVYRLFFLSIEPLSALLGAYSTYFHPNSSLPSLPSPPSPLPPHTTITLSQLANMYLFFALNEALVLRATADMRVWRTLLCILLLADFGHLWAMKSLGASVFWDLRGWGVWECANLGVVYGGAMLRIAFLAGVGLRRRVGRVEEGRGKRV
jgi:hypothetical protein